MSDKYAAITAHHRDRFAVSLMCRALQVSLSAYYAHVQRAALPPPTRTVQAEQARVAVRAMFAQCRRRYGEPRVHRALRASGVRVAKKSVARIMREDGLVARRPTPFVCTTDSRHADSIAENRLRRRFALTDCPQLDRVWVGDMTYIPTDAGWLYLAVRLDLASRRVVGWALGTTLATVLPLTALRRALAWRQPTAGLLHHTDRGSAYASREYQAVLAEHGALASMSRKGDCWDNAVAESFFATFEHECLALTTFRSHREAEHAITEFIEDWYNPVRQHSTLRTVSPVEYERQLRHQAKAA